jgi:uroporphyrinogen-III synthase
VLGNGRGRARAGLAIDGCRCSKSAGRLGPPPAERIDGLLLGSANALRQAGPGLDAFRGKPAFAVGLATARAAEAAGLTVAAVGRSGLQALLASQRPPLTLLRLAGEQHVPLKCPLGIIIETRVAYRNVALPMPDALVAGLGAGGVVLLHSAAAARHFAAECDRLGIPRPAVALAALGRALRWRRARAGARCAGRTRRTSPRCWLWRATCAMNRARGKTKRPERRV